MLVIGAGGHALEILDVLLQDNYPHPIYFYDDITPSLTSFRGFPCRKERNYAKGDLSCQLFSLFWELGIRFIERICMKNLNLLAAVSRALFLTKVFIPPNY